MEEEYEDDIEYEEENIDDEIDPDWEYFDREKEHYVYGLY